MGWYTINPVTITIEDLPNITIGYSTNEFTVLDVNNNFNKTMNLIINTPIISTSGTGGTQTTRVYKGGNVIRTLIYTGTGYYKILGKAVLNVQPGENVRVTMQSSVGTISTTISPQYIWVDPEILVLYSGVEDVVKTTSPESPPPSEQFGTYNHKYKLIFTPNTLVYRIESAGGPGKLVYGSIKVNGEIFKEGKSGNTYNNYYVDGIVRSDGGVFSAISGIKIFQIN